MNLTPERAVVVDAHCSGKEQAVTERELLLSEEPEGVVLSPVVERWLNRSGGANGLETRRREEIALAADVGVSVRVVLRTTGGLRRPRPRQVEVD